MKSKCFFCENKGKVCDFGVHFGSFCVSGIAVCPECQKWIRKHIGVVCFGCSSAYWVVRTPETEKYAEDEPGMTPIIVFRGYIIYSIQVCKLCEEGGTVH